MFDRLSYFFRNYFGFSKRETRGSILLLLLLFLSMLVPVGIQAGLFSQSYRSDLIIYEEPWLDSLSLALARASSEKELPKHNQYSDASDKSSNEAVNKPVLSPFDPNIATVAEFRKLGMPEWLATRIVKYRNKGGVFRKKDDLSRIYGMSEEQFTTLRPYITLPEKYEKPIYEAGNEEVEPKGSNTEPFDSAAAARREAFASVTFPFDLNEADSVQLMALTGVGTKTSEKILNRRSELGGYIHFGQLEEIWGISDEALDELEAKTFISSDFEPLKLKVNTAEAEELWDHPYIQRYQARAIVAYRNQHGEFTSLEDLSLIKVLKKEVLDKIAPYIDFSSADKET